MITGRPAILTEEMAKDIMDSRGKSKPETYDNIAKRLGISASTVSGFYYRAIREGGIVLRRVMTDEDKETIKRLYYVEGKRGIAISTITGFSRYRIEKYLGILPCKKEIDVPKFVTKTNILNRLWA